MKPTLEEQFDEALKDPQARARLAEYFAILREWHEQATNPEAARAPQDAPPRSDADPKDAASD